MNDELLGILILLLLGLMVIQLVREYRTRKSLLKAISLLTDLIENQTEAEKRFKDLILEKNPHLKPIIDAEIEKWRQEKQ